MASPRCNEEAGTIHIPDFFAPIFGGTELAGAPLWFRALLGMGDDAAFGGLSRAAEYGIKPYNTLRQMLQGSGLQAHHLIEQRFAAILGQNARQMLSVAVTQAEHQAFTNAWRALIPYGEGTATATAPAVIQAARQIYANYPAILRALGL